MSVSTEETFFTSARSRRLACDRCHRHKLRCERSPVIVNGGIAVPLGSCKRCIKARVSCQTIAGTFTTVASMSASGSVRRKSRVVDAEEKITEESSITGSSVSFSATSEAAVTYDETLYGTGSPSLDATEASMLDVDTFDFGSGDFTSLESTATTCSATLSSPALVSSPLNTCGLLLDEEPGSDDTQRTQMDCSGAPVQYEGFVDLACFGLLAHSSDTGSDTPTDRGLLAGTAKGATSLPPLELGSREDCRQRLLELHSLLFNELQCITHADLVDALFSPESPGLPSRDKAGPGDNIVRRVLFASERLIELLGIIRGPASSRERDRERRPGVSGTGALLRHSLLAASSAGSNSAGSTSNAGEMFLEGAPSFVDLPIVISFLTCYVGLLSVYRAVFTHIHDALRACEPARPTSGGRHRSWPGYAPRSIRGLSQSPQPTLTSQHVLGIRIQMEVMTHMLEQVDDAWVGAAAMDDRDGAESQAEMMDREGGSLFGSPATTALLQSMLRYEGYACASDEGCRMGLGSLMNLQKSIRKLLRSSNFAESF